MCMTLDEGRVRTIDVHDVRCGEGEEMCMMVDERGRGQDKSSSWTLGIRNNILLMHIP